MQKKYICKTKNVYNSLRDFNHYLKYELLKSIKDYAMKVVYCGIGQEYKSIEEARRAPENKKTTLWQRVYIYESETEIQILARCRGSKAETRSYLQVFSLNGENITKITGLQAFTQVNRAYKIPDYRKELPNLINEKGSFGMSAAPIIDYNPDYNCKKLTNVYEYDINSAYASSIIDKIPDTSKIIGSNRVVKKNEIGFRYDRSCSMVNKGGFADIIFSLIDTPKSLKNWLFKMYEGKKNNTGAEKVKYKAYLNYWVGYTQRVNPFLRSYIVNKCNERISVLIDDDTIMWNTDAIYTTKRRPELEIGNELGQFKEIFIKKLYINGNNYQINNEIPSYRGIPKAWFKSFEKEHGRKYDMSIDGIPPRINKYYFDKESFRIKEN